MKKLWHGVEKILGIYRWHPKIALRYLPVVEKIKALGSTSSIVEVGSGGLGIAPYLKRQVVGVDLSFPPPLHPLLTPVLGSATDLPFAARAFDIVVSLDMIEHIPPKLRERGIFEMLRVGKTLVCLGMPCGREAQLQDKQLEQEYKIKRGEGFDFLSEHFEYGLPTKQEILSAIEGSARKLNLQIEVETIGNLNLSWRLWLMRGWLAQNFLVNLFFRKFLLLGIPAFRRLNQPPTYRQLFFVKIQR